MKKKGDVILLKPGFEPDRVLQTCAAGELPPESHCSALQQGITPSYPSGSVIHSLTNKMGTKNN